MKESFNGPRGRITSVFILPPRWKPFFGHGDHALSDEKNEIIASSFLGGGIGVNRRGYKSCRIQGESVRPP